MKQYAKRAIESFLAKRGLTIIPRAAHTALVDALVRSGKWKLLDLVQDANLRQAIAALNEGESQLGQDMLVLEMTRWKRDGYFVEFGATDGRTLSNSWLLETKFGWRGILAEPARIWHPALLAGGRSAHIEHDCVWDKTGEELTFRETEMAELSTVSDYSARDSHAATRRTGRNYAIRTIAINDLLAKYDAPALMDYLSIDTEGSELKILQSLDFSRWRFRVITCEHNFTVDREAIHSLLTAKGYVRRWEEYSQWDDWYFLQP